MRGLFVDKEFQHNGIGKTIVNFVENHLRDSGVNYLWSGQRGIWSSNNVYGKWETYFNKGLYNIKAKFNDVQLNNNSKFILELNQKVYSKSISKYFDTENFIELKNIRVDEGKYSLIPFLRNGNKNLLPFYLEIEKIN